MKTYNTPILDKKLGKTLTFHVLNGNFNVNINSKTITASIASYIDDTITNNISNDFVRPSKNTPINITNADTTQNIETVIDEYIRGNWDVIFSQ